MKRAEVVFASRYRGVVNVYAGNIEERWRIASVPTEAEANAMVRRLSGWFRCAAMLADGTWLKSPARVS